MRSTISGRWSSLRRSWAGSLEKKPGDPRTEPWPARRGAPGGLQSSRSMGLQSTSVKRRVLPALDREAVVEALRKRLESRPEILCAYLHGSFLEGGLYQDVDVAVWVDPAHVSADSAVQFAVDLSADLSLALGQPVEVH